MSGIGRNEKCSCGSGRKFKHCCLNKKKIQVPLEVLHNFKERQEREVRIKDKYGMVRPIISTDYQGQKVIAVGERLYFNPKWKTFVDFLHDYIKDVFGAAWWNIERSKPSNLKSIVHQWADAPMNTKSKTGKMRVSYSL